jgi:hypothetical protein
LIITKYIFIIFVHETKDWFIDWCLTPTLAIFQLYRGVSKFYY